MNAFDKLLDICLGFRESSASISSLQEMLTTVYLPDDYNGSLENSLYNFYNELERIIFSEGEIHGRVAAIAASEQFAKVVAYEKTHTKQWLQSVVSQRLCKPKPTKGKG